MQDENGIGTADSVDRSIGVGTEVNDDLDYPRTVVAFECFRIRMLSSLLRHSKCVTCNALGATWEDTKIPLARSHEHEWRRWTIGYGVCGMLIHIIPVQVYDQCKDMQPDRCRQEPMILARWIFRLGYCTGAITNVARQITVAMTISRCGSRRRRNGVGGTEWSRKAGQSSGVATGLVTTLRNGEIDEKESCRGWCQRNHYGWHR